MAREGSGPPIEVRRSARRRKTVSAFWEGGTAVVAIPARFSKSEEEHWVRRMVERLEKDAARRSGQRTDTELMAKAAELSARYLAGRAQPATVRWVTNQNSRWGSCTPAERSIRLSHELQEMPQWVIDYVLVHELAHLLVHGHTADFWALVDGYPRSAEAKAFLAGVSFATSRGLTGGTAPA
ncbi:M48 family metallopeptidase [Sinomonas sp. ASV322]|uniref:M48 metallopeptidase family protein n=1 Tax=Sinomonas sp. ASV322 TaxID=3041920 RepID=UPI0027DE12A8|nr:M48 family metallopeptidase [Sinomonas sp. ASV322]MDQ4503299.1 M48 family metallopeptidase [Sinomonas sp. ASV322]